MMVTRYAGFIETLALERGITMERLELLELADQLKSHNCDPKRLERAVNIAAETVAHGPSVIRQAVGLLVTSTLTGVEFPNVVDASTSSAAPKRRKQ